MPTEEEKTSPDLNAQLASLKISPERKMPKRNSFTAYAFLFVGVLVGLALSLALKGRDSAETKAAADAKAAPAPTKPAEPKVGDVVLTATGYVTPRRRIALSPQVSGLVVWVGIEKSDIVQKDQILVRLRDVEYKARLAQAEANAANAKARLEELLAGSRIEDINVAKAAVAQQEALLAQAERTLARIKPSVEAKTESQQRLDDALGNRDAAAAQLLSTQALLARALAGPRSEEIASARATLAAANAATDDARVQLSDTVILAPSKGTVLEKLIEVGELVTPQNFGGARGARSELLSIADLSDLQVEVDVNEVDFQKIKAGNGARVTLDAYPTTVYEASIREIAPAADRQKATVQVKVAIKAPDVKVRPEMSARVDFLQE